MRPGEACNRIPIALHVDGVLGHDGQARHPRGERTASYQLHRAPEDDRTIDHRATDAVDTRSGFGGGREIAERSKRRGVERVARAGHRQRTDSHGPERIVGAVAVGEATVDVEDRVGIQVFACVQRAVRHSRRAQRIDEVFVAVFGSLPAQRIAVITAIGNVDAVARDAGVGLRQVAGVEGRVLYGAAWVNHLAAFWASIIT